MKVYIKYFIERFILLLTLPAIVLGIIYYIQYFPLLLIHFLLAVFLACSETFIKIIYNYFYREKSDLDDEDHATFI